MHCAGVNSVFKALAMCIVGSKSQGGSKGGGGACNPSVYGDKGGIPVELQLPVSFVQLLFSTLSHTEGSHES